MNRHQKKASARTIAITLELLFKMSRITGEERYRGFETSELFLSPLLPRLSCYFWRALFSFFPFLDTAAEKAEEGMEEGERKIYRQRSADCIE